MELGISNLSYVVDKKLIINNLSYVFKNGINVIIGNSCGKSTLFDLIDFLKVPSEGMIKIDDVLLNKVNIKKLRNKIGYLFQEKDTSFFCKNVYEEIVFGLKKFNIKCDYDKKVNEVLNLLLLDTSYLKVSPFSLSYGEKTKLALACLLAIDPDILLLDEPTLGLDGKSKNNLIYLLNRLKKNKVIIIASNDIEFISKISDDVIVMDKGSICYDGKLDELYEKDFVSHFEKNSELDFISYVMDNKNVKLKYCNDINKLCKEIKKHV